MSNYTIDLSSLNGTELSHTDVTQSDNFTYRYTPCQNGLSYQGLPVMATYNTDYNKLYMAKWKDISPTYSNGTFTYKWTNGETEPVCAPATQYTHLMLIGLVVQVKPTLQK